MQANLGKKSFSDIANVKAIGHPAKMSWSESSKFNRGPRAVGFGLVCNYCHEKGHWKAGCRSHTGGKYAKPVSLSAPVRHVPVVSEQVVDLVKPKTEKFSGFETFVSDGFAALQGSDSKVPVENPARYRSERFFYSCLCVAFFSRVGYW